MPVGLTQYGSIGTVTYYDPTVNNVNNGPTAMQLAMQKAQQNKKFSLKDSEYMAAVESGDMETAQRMVDEAAEAAMKHSAIRDNKGKESVKYSV